MSSLSRRLGTAWRVARAEGPRAALDRARDRMDERRERERVTAASPGWLGPASIVTVLGMPPWPRLGGVPTQLRNRFDVESEENPCVTLFPDGADWRLERRHRGAVAVLEAGPADFAEAALRAMREVGAEALHVEGLAGLPLDGVWALAEQGVRLLLSVHDFTFFCRRPHLIERPVERFCEYSRDMDRCHACLRQDFAVDAGFQARYRERAGALLRAAEVVIFPSTFLRDVAVDLVPGLDPARLRVIEPGTPPGPTAAKAPRAGEVKHVAWVGAVQIHKGALVFEEAVRRLQAERLPVRWTALGGGDVSLLARFRALPGVAVRGYWRAGTLPSVLNGLGVDVALLLSIWPETYGLTLDESWRGGASVVAFDHGAVAERVRRLGGGWLVPPRDGPEGVARAVREALAGPLPAVPDPARLPVPARAAAEHLDLYRDLGLLPARSA